jgi:hypothetical protein
MAGASVTHLVLHWLLFDRRNAKAPRAQDFWYRRAVSIDLGRRLIAAGIVPPEEVEAALFLSCVRGAPFVRVLLDRGAVSARGLEEELERVGGLGLRQVVGSEDLVARLPRAMCRRFAALPVRVDNVTGTVDVAAADPLDVHIQSEFGFHLGAPIRVLRAPIAAIEEAIRRLELDDQTPGPGRSRRVTPPFPHGAPQSSMPPPEAEEAPILLVRRLPVAPSAPEAEPTRPAVPPTPPEGGEGDRSSLIRQARIDRAARLASSAEPPAVSFPSEPPSAGYDPAAVSPRPMRPEAPAILGATSRRRVVQESPHITPPYGTPVAAPPSAPFDPDAEPADRAVARTTVRPPAFVEPAPPPPSQDEPVAAAAVEEPAAPPPPPVRAPDGATVLESLRRVTNRDEVVRLALRGLHLVAPRFGVFAVKRDGFHGWACNVELADPDAFRRLRIPLDQPSVLATAAATSLYLGPIPTTPAHAPLLALLGRSSPDVAAIAVRVGGRPALVLLADELEDTLLGTRYLDELGRAIGDALSRLLVTRG